MGINEGYVGQLVVRIDARAKVTGEARAVLTAKDVPVNEYGLQTPDQPVLCGPGSAKPGADVVRFVGDRVAPVVAENRVEIPTIADVPERVDSIIIEHADLRGPWGARGLGEMPFLPPAPALVAAVHDATGIWFDELPLTPEGVLWGLTRRPR